MKIQIEVPQIVCSRCSKTGSHDPTVLQQAAADNSAVDSRGMPWKVVASKLAAGWESVGERVVCPSCAATWKLIADKFFDGMGPEKMVSEVDTWADAETKSRAVAHRGPTIPATRPVVEVATPQRAELARGSNIPQVAPPPSYSSNYIHTSRQVVRHVSTAAPIPTHSPTPAAAQLNQQMPPLPQPTIISARVNPGLQPGGKITTQPPAQQHKRSAVASIPVQAQREVTPVTGAPPFAVEVRESPVPQSPEVKDVRVDRVVSSVAEARENPIPQAPDRAGTRVDRVIDAEDATASLAEAGDVVLPDDVSGYGAVGESTDKDVA